MQNYTKKFNELDKTKSDIAGGKGASLGEMLNAGIPVPDGFVVLSTTFENFLHKADLIQEIDAILESVDHKAVHSVDQASEKIQELINHAGMPYDIASEIENQFTQLDCEFVAVRSSATAEDGADHAWAGQLDSYLNTTKDTLLEKVKHCWASLFTPRAIFYRFEKGLNTTKISVAVVVQKMVNSEKSGIAFSVHPVTEDRNQIIIEAGFGLGEAIVSGSVTPDSYVVSKEPRKIIDINVSNQTRAMYRKSGGGNEWLDIPEKGGSQVFNESEILALSEIIMTIEDHYGFPCDIEWAFEDGKFYIVQSRPITTLGEEKDFIKRKITHSLNNDDYINKSFDANNTYFSIQMDSLRFLSDVFEEIVWENEFYSIKDGHAKIFIPKTDLSKIRKLFEQKIKNNPNFFNELYSKLEYKFEEFRKNYISYLDQIDNQSTLEETRNWIHFFYQQVQSTVGNAYITDGIGLDFEAWMPFLPIVKEEFIEVVRPLKSSFTKEFEYELASFKVSNSNCIDDFIKKYSWVENSYSVIDRLTIESLKQKLDFMSLKESKEIISNYSKDTIEIQHSEFLKNKNFNEYQLSIALSLCKAIDLQDSRKEIVFRSNTILQKAYKKLFTYYGYSQNDIDDVIEGAYYKWITELSSTDLLEKSKEALAGFTWFMNGDTCLGDEALIILPRDFNSLNSSNEIKGFTANKGKVSGKVAIVLNGSDYKKVTEGCILVTTMTRPEMIPIMQKAAGFITDDGGITCHAAIVARELNKPCIIGTKNATNLLNDGDVVEVDADNGFIRKI